MNMRVRGLGLALILAGVIAGVVGTRLDLGGVSVHTVTVGASPNYVAVDARTNRVFVTNSTSNNVSILNAEAVQASVDVGGTPLPVVVAARANRAFVLNDSGNSVSMLDATTGLVLNTVFLPYPVDAAVDDNSDHLFILHGGCGTAYQVVMLDALSGRILHTAPLAGAPQGIAVDSRARRVLVTNPGDSTVDILDTVSGRVVRTVAMGAVPAAVAVDDKNGHAFVTDRSNNMVSMLDARSGAVLRTVAVGLSPTSVVVDTRTARVFVVNAGDGTVSVLDADTGTRLNTVSVGWDRVKGMSDSTNPRDIVVDERRGLVFVLNGSSMTHIPTRGSVSVLNATSGEVRRTVPLGLFPLGEAVDEVNHRLFVVNERAGPPSAGARLWGWLPEGVRPMFSFLTPGTESVNGAVSVIDTSSI
jgi:YVTN family beta-propeller protein